MSKDRHKLKEQRQESSKLKKRITGESSSGSKSSKSTVGKKKYVIDEDAFYNQKEGEDSDGMEEDKGKKSSKYDKPMGEPNLAKKLGLDEDPEEKANREKDKDRKKTKEELEKEKEIDEVRQIIEGSSKFNKYIKEVDLLGGETMEESPAKKTISSKKVALPTKKPAPAPVNELDLLGMEIQAPKEEPKFEDIDLGRNQL